jgi:hypothetical protein
VKCRVFNNAQDTLWSQYLADADAHDKNLTDSWMGDTDGILIFERQALSVDYAPR